MKVLRFGFYFLKYILWRRNPRVSMVSGAEALKARILWSKIIRGHSGIEVAVRAIKNHRVIIIMSENKVKSLYRLVKEC